MGVRSILAVVAVVAVLGLLTFGLLSKGSSSLQVGEQAPVATMPLLDGEGSGSLADYRGRWVLVNLWASWCVPCHDEAPALEEFQRRHAGPRFTVLGIDTEDLRGDGLAFMRRYDLSYPQLRDGDGEAAEEFRTKGVPESYLVDPRGRVALVALGPLSEEYLRERVAPLVTRERS